MRRRAWLLVMFLAGAVLCVSAIPPTDLPETSYDEADTPVNQAPPVVQGMRFVKPPQVIVILPVTARETSTKLLSPPHFERPAASLESPPSIQDLHAVLRI